MSIRKKVAWLIVLSSVARLLVAAFTEFGNDEVYYYTYALHLQSNYFDHPPGVALLIKLTTLNLAFTSEIFVRSGAILCAAAGTWIVYKTGTSIRNERTGFYAAVLYNTSLYSSIIAGVFILPDSPQVICWLAAFYLAVCLVKTASAGARPGAALWLLTGIAAGICIMCKIHGIFLWAGIGSYAIFYERKLFSSPWLYLSALLTLLIISPIFFWNLDNHFITWTYHSSRVEIHDRLIHWDDFLQAFFGQVFYNNPVNVLLVVTALIAIAKKKMQSNAAIKLVLLTGLPIIVVVTVLSLFNNVLPHWSGPGFVTLGYLAAAWLDEKVTVTRKELPAYLKTALYLLIITVSGGLVLVNFYPGTLSTNKHHLGSGDFTLDLSGWNSFEKAYSKWLHQTTNGSYYAGLKIAGNKWFPASHLEYYIARPLHTTVAGIGYLHDLHHYAWLNRSRGDIKTGEDAMIIIPSNYFTDAGKTFGAYFQSVTPLQTFVAVRNGKPARYFYVYLAKGFKANDELHAKELTAN